MIVLIPVAGLGNRIRVVCSCYQFCKENNKAMSIKWMREPGFNASWNDLFEYPNRIVINNHSILNYFLYSNPSIKNLYVSKLLDKITNRQIYYSLYKDSLSSLTNNGKLYINTYCQQGELSCINELFKPNKFLRNKIDAITSKFTEETIGLHMRTTDNEESKSVSTIDKFESRIDKYIIDHPTAIFFLCTDNLNIKDKLKNKYKNRIITYNSVLNRNSTLGIQDAVVELWSLASTKEIWGSYYSSFTDMASLIYGSQLEIIK